MAAVKDTAPGALEGLKGKGAHESEEPELPPCTSGDKSLCRGGPMQRRQCQSPSRVAHLLEPSWLIRPPSAFRCTVPVETFRAEFKPAALALGLGSTHAVCNQLNITMGCFRDLVLQALQQESSADTNPPSALRVGCTPSELTLPDPALPPRRSSGRSKGETAWRRCSPEEQSTMRAAVRKVVVGLEPESQLALRTRRSRGEATGAFGRDRSP